jgi:hypothetical protein
MALGDLTLTRGIYTVTIGIGRSAQFASTEFPRQHINPKSVGYTPAATSLVEGNTFARYQWVISARMQTAVLSNLLALWEDSNSNVNSGGTGAISISDETEKYITGLTFTGSCFIPKRPELSEPGNWTVVSFVANQL